MEIPAEEPRKYLYESLNFNGNLHNLREEMSNNRDWDKREILAIQFSGYGSIILWREPCL